MLVQVQLLPPDDKDPSHRVDLPNAILRHGNITKGTAIADIPPDDFPVVDKDIYPGKWDETVDGPLLVELSDEDHALWHRHLDQLYPSEHRVYRPKVVKYE